MRLGAIFSAVLDPSRPALFGDGLDLSLQPQEEWHPSVAGERIYLSQSMTYGHECKLEPIAILPLPSSIGCHGARSYDYQAGACSC